MKQRVRLCFVVMDIVAMEIVLKNGLTKSRQYYIIISVGFLCRA